MDYQSLVEKVVNQVLIMKETNPAISEQLETMKDSLAKYGVSFDRVVAKIGEPADYRKILLQIITDLRYSKGTNYNFDMTESYRDDRLVLHEITKLIEAETDEFNDPNLGFINIADINADDYDAIVDAYQLVK